MKRLLVSVLLILSAFTSVVYSETAEEYMRKLRSESIKMLPGAFEAVVSSRSMDQKVQTIPEDYVDSGKKAVVKVSFALEKGVEIYVDHVDDLYRDMFQQYERFFMMGPLISLQDEEALSLYDYSFVGKQENDDGEMRRILKMNVKNAETYYFIYVDEKNWSIERADYFQGEDILFSSVVEYEEVDLGGDTYLLPVRFASTTYRAGRSVKEVFEIFDFESAE